MQEVFGKDQNLPSLNAPKLDLDQNQLLEVDKFVKKDISGNSFVNKQDLKKLKLSDTQIQQVNLAIDSYNQLPLELKDGSYQASQQILQSSTFQSELQKQDSLVDVAVSSLEGVKVRAVTYYVSGGFSVSFKWWGIGVKVPGDVIAEMEWHLGNWGLSSAIGVLVGHATSKCGVYTVYCTAAALALYTGYWSFTSYNKYRCNSKGVTIWKPLVGKSFWFTC